MVLHRTIPGLTALGTTFEQEMENIPVAMFWRSITVGTVHSELVSIKVMREVCSRHKFVTECNRIDLDHIPLYFDL